jgi:hypothetical protein
MICENNRGTEMKSELRIGFENGGFLSGKEKPAGEILLMALEKGPKAAMRKFGKTLICRRFVESGIFDVRKNRVCLDSHDETGVALAVGVGLGYLERRPLNEAER